MLKRSTVLALGFSALAAAWGSAPVTADISDNALNPNALNPNSLSQNALSNNALSPNGLNSTNDKPTVYEKATEKKQGG